MELIVAARGRIREARRSAVGARADQAGLVGQDDRLDPVAQLQRGQDPGHVGLYRRLAQRQRRGELGVAQAAAPYRRRPPAQSIQVRAAGRAASRSSPIGRPHRSHTPYRPSASRSSAASTAATCSRAASSRAAACCRSNASVAPSGSCSSSVPAELAASASPANSRSSAATRCLARARSVRSTSCAVAISYWPTRPSIRSRRRSAWPWCRAYSCSCPPSSAVRTRSATGLAPRPVPQHPHQLLGHNQRGQTAWIGLRLSLLFNLCCPGCRIWPGQPRPRRGAPAGQLVDCVRRKSCVSRNIWRTVAA